jgi:hypothetical protein
VFVPVDNDAHYFRAKKPVRVLPSENYPITGGVKSFEKICGGN